MFHIQPIRTTSVPRFYAGVLGINLLVPKAYVSSSANIQSVQNNLQVPASPRPAFNRLSTPTLVRAIILGSIFKRPWLYKPGLKLMRKAAASKSRFLDADRNPLLRALLYPLIYKQFCAGRNPAEVRDTMRSIKDMGYSGIILGHTREITVDDEDVSRSREQASEASVIENIRVWRDSNLATLETVGRGDYIGIKLTGAHTSISADIAAGKSMRKDFLEALDVVCKRAKEQGKRLWLDAEEQKYHPAIDNVAIHFMRKYNTNRQVLMLNTIQAYLKSARDNLDWQLRLAQKEKWALGIKLVRGAYIMTEHRKLIHDTKADTDANYDGIVHDIMTQQWPGIDEKDFPIVKLFIASHNQVSVKKAHDTAVELYRAGKLQAPAEFGQIQGIADDIGCEMLEKCDQSAETKACVRMFKCLAWGSIQECIHYLVRRAIENQGAAERLNTHQTEMVKELRRRLLLG